MYLYNFYISQKLEPANPVSFFNTTLFSNPQGFINLFDEPILFQFIHQPMETEIHSLKENLVFKEKQICLIKDELHHKRIDAQLEQNSFKVKIQEFQKLLEDHICSEHPNAFWHRKKHIVSLPYENDFDEKKISTKARPIQMSKELLKFCKAEIQGLLDKNLIRKSKSLWSCSAFYVNKNAKIERGVPRLVINYKPLNTALK